MPSLPASSPLIVSTIALPHPGPDTSGVHGESAGQFAPLSWHGRIKNPGSRCNDVHRRDLVVDQKDERLKMTLLTKHRNALGVSGGSGTAGAPRSNPLQVFV
jgi:hypothetical protein